MVHNLHNARWKRFILAEQVRQLITEGLDDIGLSETNKIAIRQALPTTSEKVQTWFATLVKNTMFVHNGPVAPLNFRTKVIVPLVGLISKYLEEPDDLPLIQSVDGVAEGVGAFLGELQGEVNNNPPIGMKNIKKLFKNVRGFVEKVIPRKYIQYTPESELGKELGDFVGKLDMYMNELFDAEVSNYSEVIGVLNEDEDTIADFSKIASEQGYRPATTSARIRLKNSMYRKARELQAAIENEDQIMHKYEDGSYWYDTQTDACDLEAARMGHCGRSQSGGRIVSLRWKDPKKKDSYSLVTLEYDEGDDTLHQIKGFRMEGDQKMGNRAPPEEIRGPGGAVINLWIKIVDFIERFGVTTNNEVGQHSSRPEEFAAMNQFIEEETGVEANNRVKELEEALQRIQEHADRVLEHTQVQYEIDDYDEEYPSASFNAEMTVELDMAYAFDGYSDQLLEELENVDEDTIKDYVISVMDYISWPEFRDSESRFFNRDGNIIFRVYVDNPYEMGTGEEAFSDLVDAMQDIEGRFEDIASDLRDYLLEHEYISSVNPEFREVAESGIFEEFEEKLKYLSHVQFDEDELSEGITFYFAENWQERKGFLVVTRQELEAKYPGIFDNPQVAEKTIEALVTQVKGRLLRMIEKMVKDYNDKIDGTTPDSLLQNLMKGPAGKDTPSQPSLPLVKAQEDEPVVIDDEAIDLRTNVKFDNWAGSQDEELRVWIGLQIQAVATEEQVAQALFLAEYLDKAMPRILQQVEDFVMKGLDALEQGAVPVGGAKERETLAAITENLDHIVDRIMNRILRG